LGVTLAVFLLVNIAAAQEVAVIKIQYRRAAELVPVVQSLLSDQGRVTVSQRVNSLVVVDSAEAIQRVYAYVVRFDTPVDQVRIRVRFHTSSAGRREAQAVRGRYSSDDLTVTIGGRKKRKNAGTYRDRQSRRIAHSEAFVVAMSGSPAFIRTGKEIPYKNSSPFIRRHAPGDETIAWQTVESGFEVTPTIAGDNVILKIVPRIAYDDSEDTVIRFFGAQTEVTAPFGQWVDIGGVGDQQNEIIQEILSQRVSSGQTVTSMSLMVQRP
jgi:type II secretory pathway component GspD/PulD (secretin)